MSAGQGAHAAGDEVVVPLRSRRRRRALLVQKLQHAIPAAGLLGSAFQTLRAGAHGFELGLALAAAVTGALLLVTFVKGLREAAARRGGDTHAHAHGVDWFDIWAAGVLFAEAAERWHLHHRVAGPQLLTAVATLGIGLFHTRLSARRERRQSLRMTPDRLYVGRNRFSHFSARWDEVAEISVTEGTATIRTHTGKRRRLNLVDLENAPEVRAALDEALRRLDASRQRFLPLPN